MRSEKVCKVEISVSVAMCVWMMCECLDVTKQESQREREFARALVCECAEVREREGRKEQKRDR